MWNNDAVIVRLLLRFQERDHWSTSETSWSGPSADSSAGGSAQRSRGCSSMSWEGRRRWHRLADLAPATTLVATDRAPLTVRASAAVAPRSECNGLHAAQHSALMNSRRKLSFSQPYSSGLKQAEPSTRRWQIGIAIPPTYDHTQHSQLSLTYATAIVLL